MCHVSSCENDETCHESCDTKKNKITFSSLTWLKLLVPLKPTFPKMQLKAPFVRPRLLNVWASHSNFLAFKL